MDSKGEESKISYPNIFFMIDSFEEVSVSPCRSPPQGMPEASLPQASHHCRKAGGGWEQGHPLFLMLDWGRWLPMA